VHAAPLTANATPRICARGHDHVLEAGIKMQFSILFVLFGLVVTTVSGFKFEKVRNNRRSLTKFLTPYYDARYDATSFGRERQRRQSSQCEEAFEEGQSDRFQQCYGALEKAEELDATTSDLNTYCSNDCTSYLIEVATKFAQYCDPDVSY